MKKTLSIILAALMLAASAVSCSNNEQNDTKNESESKTESSSASESEGAEEISGYYNEMEAIDYDGWTFRIASQAPSTYCFRVMTVEELGIDEFSDMIYNRQIAVEDKYQIKIVEEQESGGAKPAIGKMKRSVQAQTRDYSLAYDILYGEISLFTDNIAIGVSDMPVLDLEKPYWDQGAIETLSIDGKMYYGLSDIGFSHYDSSAVLFYNGVLLGEHQLESPYDLYKAGKWTTDKMHEMMSTTAQDINGDGQMSETDDVYGFVGRTGMFQGIVAASDCALMTFDNDANAGVVHLADERMLKVGEATKMLFFDTNIALEDDYNSVANAGEMFISGRALFYGHLLGSFRALRSAEDDYGIINFPSIEENTKGLSYCQNPEGYFIASDCEDQERLATILEAMNTYSYDYILDAYIQKTVIGKGARDQQSAEIIRENFAGRYYDLSEAIGCSSVASGWINALRKDSYASMQQIAEKKVTKTVKDVLSALEE